MNFCCKFICRLLVFSEFWIIVLDSIFPSSVDPDQMASEEGVALLNIQHDKGHGKLVDPPGRNTVMNTQRGGSYRKECSTGDINYSDTGNFCGGKTTQERNGGRCSACGDNWAADYPRKHDSGGIFAKKITPVRVYLQGQTITVKVVITASHEGYFEFKLCPTLEGEGEDDMLTKCYEDATQYRLLQMTDGKTRAEGISQTMEYTYDLQLPKDVNCAKGCNLQWWYKTGNSWGCDPDGSCGIGKGPQEHFVNCADILILTCEQYKSGRYPDWCGYGPTEDLENCIVTTGTDVDTTTTTTDSGTLDSSSETEPGPGEATGAGTGTGTGIEPMQPAGTDQGTEEQKDHGFLRVCYYSNWSQYRNGKGKFFPENIDPYLCTHLIYSFAKLQNNKLATYEWNDDQLYKRFNQLKMINPSLKTLLAVGGWNFGSQKFSSLVASESLRKTFASTSVQFLRVHGFDGLDMDWEYPALRGGVDADKGNFVLLLKDLKEEFEREHQESGQSRLLLTAAVAAGKKTIVAAYDIPGMNRYLDFINLMSYDLHGAWESFTGHHAPLQEDDLEAQLNVDWAARYWRDNGTPANKLIIGLATYGRTFTLANANTYGLGATTKGAGSMGQYTGEAGFISYYEEFSRTQESVRLSHGIRAIGVRAIEVLLYVRLLNQSAAVYRLQYVMMVCLKLSRNEGVRKWDEERQVPYLVDGNQWIGYDDKESITAKLRYIRDNKYGGAMVWNIDLDDFNHICPLSEIKYPLMSLMTEILDTSAYDTTTTNPSESSSDTEEPVDESSNPAYNQPSDTQSNGPTEPQNTGNTGDNPNEDKVLGPTNIDGTENSFNDDSDNNNLNTANDDKDDESTSSDQDDGGDNTWRPGPAEHFPALPQTIDCETCYRNGQPFCDLCCETVVTSEHRGTRPVFDKWCQAVCPRGFCPDSHCETSDMKHFNQMCDIPYIPNSSDSIPTPSCDECQRQKSETCGNPCCEKRMTKMFKGHSSRFDVWCTNNCAVGFCPNSHCYTEHETVWTGVCVVALRNLHDLLGDFEGDSAKQKED